MDKGKYKSNLPICCESCAARSKGGEEFKKLISLTSSGLSVYVNTDINKKESVILHNVGNKALVKPDIIGELSSRRNKCYLCNALIRRVCNLINEVTEIKENETIAICDHCQRSTAITCKKCDDILKRFLSNQINQYQCRQQALKIRLYEVRRILSLIVEKKNICDHKICQAYYDSNAELKILLELIKSPLRNERPDIEEYFSLMEQRKDSVPENDENQLFLKYSGVYCESKESLIAAASEPSSESFCICKYLRDRSIVSTRSFALPSTTLEPYPTLVTQSKFLEKSTSNVLKDINEKSSGDKTFKKKLKNKDEKETVPIKSQGKKKVNMDGDKENIPVKKQRDKSEENKQQNVTPERKKQQNVTPERKKQQNVTPEGKKQSPEKDPDYAMTLKLINAKKKQMKRANVNEKKDKLPAIPKMQDLPEIKYVEKKDTGSETSGSIIVCDQKDPLDSPKAVLGNRIVPVNELQRFGPYDNVPLFYKVRHDFTPPDETLTETVTTTANTTTTTSPQQHHEQHHHQQRTTTNKVPILRDKIMPGVIKYELSNKTFIENGWTKLPVTKVVRKMNIYKMVPAYPQFDWFANHKHQCLFYNTGEKLAEVDVDECGRWFYKDGHVALEYYKSNDPRTGLKYVVYDIDEDITQRKKNKTRRILASFDHLGNGIVYDNVGNVRLKYNQSEGVIIDKKLGPPGKWKWHTLNDPPVLQHIYVDTIEESKACVKDVVKQHIDDPDFKRKVDCEEMLAIEFENFVKEKATKMLQCFKPFEIRMKAVKINDYFSVKIMNQANIQLFFRCNQVSLKVNMGMLLISTEIVDTKVADVADVATPFEQPISRSMSVNSI